jgi:HEAT repeat protein
VEIGSAGAMQMLERSLADDDRDIRIAAVRAVGARGHRAALPRIESIVKSRELRAADLTERMAFFEGFGALCGETGIPYLDGLLNGKSGLLGRREDAESRACAAIALGQMKSPKAQQALQKALAEKDLVVRNAVNRALRSGSA